MAHHCADLLSRQKDFRRFPDGGQQIAGNEKLIEAIHFIFQDYAAYFAEQVKVHQDGNKMHRARYVKSHCNTIAFTKRAAERLRPFIENDPNGRKTEVLLVSHNALHMKLPGR